MKGETVRGLPGRDQQPSKVLLPPGVQIKSKGWELAP